MIELNNNGIFADEVFEEKTINFLWDCLELVGFRHTLITRINKKKIEYKFAGKSDLIKVKGSKILLFNFSTKKEFIEIIKILNSINAEEFFITINASFENIISTINELVEYDDLFFEDYQREYPKTIHVKEDSFLIDFEKFKEYKYPLQRVYKRHE